MTYRHSPGDILCSKNDPGRNWVSPSTPATPDAKKFDIEEIVEVGPHIVLKVKYPNCAKYARGKA